VLENQNRVLRGGGYDERPATLRSAARSEDRPSQRWTSVGLRVARTRR
jgi:formylglycine-generating enzyme required for sulfatase activity